MVIRRVVLLYKIQEQQLKLPIQDIMNDNPDECKDVGC